MTLTQSGITSGRRVGGYVTELGIIQVTFVQGPVKSEIHQQLLIFICLLRSFEVTGILFPVSDSIETTAAET